MKNKIDYNYFLKNIYFSIPKRIKGDSHEIKEIKIHKNNLYVPKTDKIYLNDMNKIHSFKNIKSLNKDDTNSSSFIINPALYPAFYYTIKTKQNNFVYIPQSNNFQTDDKDLKNLIDLMNEFPTKDLGYSSVIDEKNCKVFKKFVEGCDIILIKSFAKLPFTKDVIYEAISNLSIRMKWDSVFDILKVIDYTKNGNEVLYMIIKSPFFLVKDREFVQQKKTWKNFANNSHILHFVSLDNPSYPRSKKAIRAETIISGYYIKDDPDEPGHSILGVVSQNDIKGNIPSFIVNNLAPISVKGWVKSLYKGCRMVLESNNQ